MIACSNCNASLEVSDQRRGVAFVVTRDGDRLCTGCVANARPGLGGGVVLSRDDIDREMEKRARKYSPGGYKRGDAAAARGPKEAA